MLAQKIKNKIRENIKGLLPGHFPDFLLVGAQKAATTALHYYLNQHPNINGSRPKEVRFFDRDENYERGLNWYKHNFPNTKNPFRKFKYFEATPEYLYRSYVPERIYEFNKNIRIVIVLRDPVQRAYSAWTTYRQFGKRRRLPAVMYSGYLKGTKNNIFKEFYNRTEFPTFEQVIETDILKFETNSPLEEPAVVRRGIYYPQVKRYIDLFGRNNVLVLGFKDLIGPKQIITLNAILNFIQLPSSDWKFLKGEPRNKSVGKDNIPIAMEEKLQLFYSRHNDELFELIGFKPNW
jgi:hypothetical protein